jgi:antitoxin ParD1/3/4
MSSMINISLPETLRKWVEKQVAEKGYGSADDFFLKMLQRERALEARERIDDLLTEALAEGTATPMTRADWERIRASGQRLARERRRK